MLISFSLSAFSMLHWPVPIQIQKKFIALITLWLHQPDDIASIFIRCDDRCNGSFCHAVPLLGLLKRIRLEKMAKKDGIQVWLRIRFNQKNRYRLKVFPKKM